MSTDVVFISEPVFFSAAADKHEDYVANDVVKFHHTFSNVNPGFDGWNPTTSIFTCPYDGYYMFLVKIQNSITSTLHFTVYLHMSDGPTHKSVVASTLNTSLSSTMFAIVPCEKGQDVWVAFTATRGRIQDWWSHFNQFSGLLLKTGLE